MQETRSFRSMREVLDRAPMRKPPRGSLRLRDYRDSEGESRENRGGYAELAPREVTARRAAFRARFPRACVDIERWIGIDQGHEGACSLLSLIHLVEIAMPSTPDAVLSRSPAALRKKDSWRGFWRPELVDRHGSTAVGVESLGATLDMSVMSGLVRASGAAALEYVPVRSAGNREQSFNEAFWAPEAQLAAAYGVPAADIAKVPYLYQNARLVEVRGGASARARARAVLALTHIHTLILTLSDRTGGARRGAPRRDQRARALPRRRCVRRDAPPLRRLVGRPLQRDERDGHRREQRGVLARREVARLHVDARGAAVRARRGRGRGRPS